ncbi:unnamed protein product [Strongylus vulgaris]|uniref:Uncharacterized protein n=1 Tax=Strongylus vulgaris TaxID=40348 RepID=A0A3P7JGB1_STRVU|nr:unnamed protein product [Strongylus vulgaris]
MQAFTVITTGKAEFHLRRNADAGYDNLRTSPATGILVSPEYPSMTGTALEQKVTYDKRMKFVVNGTVNLNDDEFITLYFKNVKSGMNVNVYNVTSSGAVSANAVAEQLLIVPSSKHAGAFLFNYFTEDTNEQQDTTPSEERKYF